jgi:hypothetical protein
MGNLTIIKPIRFTVEEVRVIEEHAKAHGKTFSFMVRQACNRIFNNVDFDEMQQSSTDLGDPKEGER